MEKQRNKTLNEYLKALNIDINELTNYELESLEKTNEYFIGENPYKIPVLQIF